MNLNELLLLRDAEANGTDRIIDRWMKANPIPEIPASAAEPSEEFTAWSCGFQAAKAEWEAKLKEYTRQIDEMRGGL